MNDSLISNPRIIALSPEGGFTTARLVMRPLNHTDNQLYRDLYCNDRIMRHIGKTLSPEQADKAFTRSLNAMKHALLQPEAACRYMAWVIVDKQSGVPIGIEGLTWQGNDHKQAGIGIMLLPQANGKLFPEEAMGALMEYAYGQLNLLRIDARFSARNLATARFVKKLGFIFSEQFKRDEIDSSIRNNDKYCYAEINHYNVGGIES